MPCPMPAGCPLTALGALTVGMSPHPQGGAAGTGQPGGVGRVRVGGWVPAQLAALQGGTAGDHEMRSQVSGAAACWVDPGELQAVLVPAGEVGGVAKVSRQPPTQLFHPILSTSALEGHADTPGSGGPGYQGPLSQLWP